MSDQNHPARRRVRGNVENLAGFSDEQVEDPEVSPDEMSRLEERLEELRSEGILSGAAGPRKAMEPIAYIPGALERFIAERD